ncbi:hypothetical protein NM688_g9 [Phlebia brevispora]|uniref:Uncharacterized protein n=1 Tax=Phlebia brevispora TaxID=194682 RepID=A0ACC1TFE5_9APHY|nr:hypothetical protein NM688_g9 [Phlebia brevispora]
MPQLARYVAQFQAAEIYVATRYADDVKVVESLRTSWEDMSLIPLYLYFPCAKSTLDPNGRHASREPASAINQRRLMEREQYFSHKSRVTPLAMFIRSAFPNDLYDLFIESSDKEDLPKLSLVNSYFCYRSQAVIFRELRIMAGPLCILRKVRKAIEDDEDEDDGILLPDTFKEILPGFRKLRPNALVHVRKVTFSGLSEYEKLTTELGSDPHLDICVLQMFLSRLPRVETVHISNVLWTPCMQKRLHPRNHRCTDEELSIALTELSLSHIAHARPADNIFDILQVVRICDNLFVSDVRWNNPGSWAGLTIRLGRSDIRRLFLRFPLTYGDCHELTLRFPVITHLTHLEVRHLGEESHAFFWDLLDLNCDSLKVLKAAVKMNSFSVERWSDLPTFCCIKLEEVTLSVHLRLHQGHSTCAGASTLQAALETLPVSMEVLRINLISLSPTTNFSCLLRHRVDWITMASTLKASGRLEEVHLTMISPDAIDRNEVVHRNWEAEVRKALNPIDVFFSSVATKDQSSLLV